MARGLAIQTNDPHYWKFEAARGRPMQEHGEVTSLLRRASHGDSAALREVLGLLHGRLRTIAHVQLAGERHGHTLETDALVHEAFLRLAALQRMEFRDREHVLAMAARTMRRVLIDYAQKRHAQKRGRGDAPLPLDAADVAIDALDQHAEDLNALDQALERLAELNPRQSQVVEFRFFVGLSIEETAEALDMSPATVKRDWIAARAWLNRELSA